MGKRDFFTQISQTDVPTNLILLILITFLPFLLVAILKLFSFVNDIVLLVL